MKPNFALNLSYEGLELLHRAPGGWLAVGAVAFDRPDLDAAIDALRAEALRLAPEGMTTKLIVPDSEVRYVTVLAPGPTDEARRYQIEAEIEGLTPYTLDELAYDWVVEGDHAVVAIVARETLREAEDFAVERGFNPVSFVARPAAGPFSGEPFFGQTGAAAAILPAGASVEPDSEPLRVLDRAPARPPTPPAAPIAVPQPAEPSSAPIAVPQPGEPPSAPVAASEPAEPPPALGAPEPRPAPAAIQPPAPDQGSVSVEATHKFGDLVRRVGTRLRREQAEAKARAEQQAETVARAEDEVAAQPEAAVVAFTSRRAVGGGGARPGVAIATPAEASPGGRLAILPRDRGKGGASSALASMARNGRGAVQKALRRLLMRLRDPAVADPVPLAAPSRVDRAGPERFRIVAARPRPVEPIVPVSRPPTSERERAIEAESLTLFGRRGRERAEPRPISAALLAAGGGVAVLAAVAVWALYFVSSPGDVAQQAPDPVETAALLPGPEIRAPDRIADPPVPAAVSPPEAAPAAAPAEPAAGTATQSPPAPSAPASETAAADPVGADPGTLADQLSQEALAETAPAEVIDRLASDAPQPAEPAPATAAPAPAAADSAPAAGTEVAARPVGMLALPGRLAVPPIEEVTPVSLPAPPPPDRIAAAAPAPVSTAEAAPEPEAAPELEPEAASEPEIEIAVRSGRPAAVPPRAPGRPALDPPVAAPTVADDTPRADPALARFRPAARSERVRALGEALRAAQPAAIDPPPPATPEPPGRLDQGALPASLAAPAAATAALTSEGPAATPTPGGVALDLLRPLRRPTDLVPPPIPAAAAAAAAPAAAEDEPAPEVVERSLMPAARPRQLAARVEAALAARRAAAAAAPDTAPPGEDRDAPAVAAAAPRLPSAASVEREATQRRAIRTREVNLIGVFGTPSNRRALVRLANGEVVRLQVGDRFEGGRVSAIGESELRYVSGGRDRVLRIASRG